MEKNEKFIDTPELFIKGNIMSWADTLIQLSNVSAVSTSDFALAPFPIWAAVLLVVGVAFLSQRDGTLFALLLLAAGGIWLYKWYTENQRRKSAKKLTIVMNSGTCFRFTINDLKFLNEVVQVLEEILIAGGVGNESVCINIKNSNFSGNTQVLNNLGINSI